jgi:hypothetical protein
MALSGSLEIEGLEIPNSYTKVKSFTYTNNSNEYHINGEYQIFVDENHRINDTIPLHSSRFNFTIVPSGSLDIFNHIYTNIQTHKYFESSSLIDC